MEYNSYMQETKKQIEDYLKKYLTYEFPYGQILIEAMKYSALNGGKRIRGILAIATSEMLKGKKENVMPVAVALEMIHAYSLVHDDLPAMDDDDLRRGQPSTHKKYREDIAILAGDGLLTHAFFVIASKIHNKSLVSDIIETLAWYSGVGGMVIGQMADVMGSQSEADAKFLDFIHKNKTGALISASCRCGAISSETTEKNIENLTIYGEKIGLAFQVMDDILDEISTEEKLGKTIGKDKEQGKITYPKIWGLEKAKGKAKNLVEEAKYNIKDIPNNNFLNYLADFIVLRDN